jgi:hypothetical protein
MNARKNSWSSPDQIQTLTRAAPDQGTTLPPPPPPPPPPSVDTTSFPFPPTVERWSPSPLFYISDIINNHPEGRGIRASSWIRYEGSCCHKHQTRTILTWETYMQVNNRALQTQRQESHFKAI